MYKSIASLKLKWEKLGKTGDILHRQNPLLQQVNYNVIVSAPKMTGQTKSLISIPDIIDLDNLLHVDSTKELINHPSSYF